MVEGFTAKNQKGDQGELGKVQELLSIIAEIWWRDLHYKLFWPPRDSFPDKILIFETMTNKRKN